MVFNNFNHSKDYLNNQFLLNERVNFSKTSKAEYELTIIKLSFVFS